MRRYTDLEMNELYFSAEIEMGKVRIGSGGVRGELR